MRDALPADAGAIAAVGRVAFTQQYEGLVDPANYTWAARQWYSDEAIEAAVEQAAEDPTAQFLVAEHDGAIVGLLQYAERGPEPELHRIYVAREARGTGVGALLMLELHARLVPAREYVLVVVEGNSSAIRFYRRHGLRQEATVSAHEYYRHTAGIVFPEQAQDFRCAFMRHGLRTHAAS